MTLHILLALKVFSRSLEAMGKPYTGRKGIMLVAERGSRLLKGEIVLSRGSLNRQGGAERL